MIWSNVLAEKRSKEWQYHLSQEKQESSQNDVVVVISIHDPEVNVTSISESF